MDYAPHGSLRKKHSRGTQVPLDSIVSYAKQAALALQYAHTHDQRVIHRDVKPENLLLKTPDFVLLSDFGIATAARTVTTANSGQDTNVAGTYAYMAPEQLVGRPCFASDQYALAIMVYEWLCGEPPFSGQEYAQWLYQHQRMSPPPLQERVPSHLVSKRWYSRLSRKSPRTALHELRTSQPARDRCIQWTG
jgi:eukaryotic-like serine/threonine-protein kinase